MKHVVVIGAGKFAVEVSHYLRDIGARGAEGYEVEQYLAVDDEPVLVTGEKCAPLSGATLPAGTRVVLALPDPARRRAVIDDVIVARELIAENVVHPTSMVDAACIDGVGNIIGPNCYLGADVVLGSHNVLNYHCTVGHHSRLGSNNFVAPNFNSGNSVQIGDDNFFGLSCTLAPELTVGDGNRFQAGITLFDRAGSGMAYVSPHRVKSVAVS